MAESVDDLRQGVESRAPFLRQRIKQTKPAPTAKAPTHRGEFVLYAPVVAFRGHENPALLAARLAAQRLNLPLLVVAPVMDDVKHFTARRLAFLLDGVKEMAREVERETKARFFALVTHPGRRRKAHLSLAAKAHLVVVDEPFVSPFVEVVAQIRTAAKRCWQVDASCLVPVASTHRHFQRAFHFEHAVKKARPDAVRQSRAAFAASHKDEDVPFAETSDDAEARARGLMGLENPSHPRPDLLSAQALLHLDAIAYAKAHAGADQAVKPVPHVARGGSSRGYDRWAAFLSRGLASYHARRGDPLQHFASGCSRMSSYLNFGMVSPFRLARDLEALPPSGGKTKFADEFYKWRGISYNHAYYSPKPPHSHEALPSWSRDSLQAHAADPRTEYSLEDLEAARTGSAVWNAMQRFLETTGELHNNCRMFWGRAIIAWSRGAEDAMRKLVHLNDKFALDGLSPPSYAGLGWCLGLFDTPQPEVAVFGKIRPKNVDTHRIKDKLDEYRQLAAFAVAPTGSSSASSPRPTGARQGRIESFFSPVSAAKRRKLND